MNERTEYLANLHLLSIYYEKIIKILDAIGNQLVYAEDTNLNRAYVLLTDRVSRILGSPGFEELMNDAPELYDNVLSEASDIEMSWEDFRPSVIQFWSKIEKLSTLNVTINFTFDYTMPEAELELMSIADNAIDKYYGLRKSAEDRIFGNKEVVASGKHVANLSFVSISTPRVVVNGKTFHLSAMRDGNAFNIVNYCMTSAANQLITLDDLKLKLKLSGVSNLNATLQKSHFDKNNGVLRAFVTSSPKSLRINNPVELSDEQVRAIELSSRQSE